MANSEEYVHIVWSPTYTRFCFLKGLGTLGKVFMLFITIKGILSIFIDTYSELFHKFLLGVEGYKKKL